MITLFFSVLHIISSEGTCALSATPRGRSQKAEKGVLKSVCSPRQVSEFVTSVVPCCCLVLTRRDIAAADLTEGSLSVHMCPVYYLDNILQRACVELTVFFWQLAGGLSGISRTSSEAAASIVCECADVCKHPHLAKITPFTRWRCWWGGIPVPCKKGHSDCISFSGSLMALKDSFLHHQFTALLSN